MEDRYIEIFEKSSYHELNSEEKKFISELCSNEEEFENVKHLYGGMESLQDESFQLNSESLKRQLDTEFKEVHSVDGGYRILKFLFPPITPFYFKPGLQIAFLLVFVVTLYFSIQSISIDKNPKVLYSQNTDTKTSKEMDEKRDSKQDEEPINDSEIEKPEELDGVLFESESNGKGSFSSEVIESDFMTKDLEDDFGNLSLSSNAIPIVSSERASMSATLARSDKDEEIFVIEPIGDNLELLEDLFVTF